MSFENIGIGGTLTFDSAGAVSNMGMASSAFARLGASASGARAGISKIGAGMGAFTLMGGLGVAGIVTGFKELVKEGGEWNAYVESTKISIGTILAAVTKTPLAENVAKADKILQHLNIVATQTHVETSEVVDTFSRLVGPMMGAGASMSEIYDFTKGTTIMASALHQPVNRASHAMSLLSGGTLMAREQTIQLLHSMGLLHESSQEWAAYLPEKRLQRMKEIMSTFAASGELLQHTWAAQSSSAKSFLKIMAGAFTKGMFSSGTDMLSKFNEAFIAHQDEWLAKLEAVGKVFSKVIGWMTNEVKMFYAGLHKVVDFVQSKLDYLDDDRLPGILKAVAHIVAQFMLWVTAMSPIISIVVFIGSKIMAVISIAEGLLGVLGAFAWPLLVVAAIAGALFLLFRHEGEGVGAFLMRVFEGVKEVVLGLWDTVSASIDLFKQGFYSLEAVGRKFWAGIQPGLDNFSEGVVGIINLFQTLWARIVPILGDIWNGFSRIIDAIRPGIEMIFNTVMSLFNVVVEYINYVLPHVMNIVRPIVNIIMNLAVKIGEALSKVFQALQPVFDGIVWVIREVLMPFAAWLWDTLGPVVLIIFDAIGEALGGIATAVGWLATKFGQWLEGTKMIYQWIGQKILGVLNDLGISTDQLKQAFVQTGEIIKTLIVEPLREAYGFVKDSTSALFSLMKDTSIFGIIDGITGAGDDAERTAEAGLTIAQMLQIQLWNAKLTAMGISGIVQAMAEELDEMYTKYAKPIVDTGLQIIQAFTGNADINAKSPSVNVDIDQNINATMCVNGRNLAVAQSQYETEVAERSGFNNTPYQTQRVQISGVKPK